MLPPPPGPLLFYRRRCTKQCNFFPSVDFGFFIFVFQKHRSKGVFFIPARFGALAAMSNMIRVFWVVMPYVLVDMKSLEGPGTSIYMVEEWCHFFGGHTLPSFSGQLIWRSQFSRLTKSHGVISQRSVMLIYITLSHIKSHNKSHLCYALHL